MEDRKIFIFKDEMFLISEYFNINDNLLMLRNFLINIINEEYNFLNKENIINENEENNILIKTIISLNKSNDFIIKLKTKNTIILKKKYKYKDINQNYINETKEYKIVKGYSLNNNELIAIKIISKLLKDNINLYNKEILNVKDINENKILTKILDNFEDNDNYYIIFEYYESNIFDLAKYQQLDIYEIQYIMIQLNKGFKFLYEFKIFDYEIEPKNILIKKINDDFEYKIAYFINSNIFSNEDKINFIPEFYKKKENNNKYLLWCIGNLLYYLSTGKFLKLQSNKEKIEINDIDNIRNEHLIDLIKKLLVDDDKKINYLEYFDHQFFKIDDDDKKINLFEDFDQQSFKIDDNITNIIKNELKIKNLKNEFINNPNECINPNHLIKFKSNPLEFNGILHFKKKISHSNNCIYFITFKKYLIFSSNQNLIIFNLKTFDIIKEYENILDGPMRYIKYYQKGKKDLIILSTTNGNVTIFDFCENNLNLNCIFNLKYNNERIFINAIIMLTYNNIDYIITSDYYTRNLQVYDIFGKCVNDNFCEDEECVIYLKHYFSVKSNKHYIIKHTIETVRSYYFENGEQYHIYSKLFAYNCIIKLINDEEYIFLPDNESSALFIFDFNEDYNLIKKISIQNKYIINSVLMWNENIIISGSNDGLLHFFDINKENEIKIIKVKYNKNIYFLDKIKIDNKEYFIFQDKDNKNINIQIWTGPNIDL